MQIFSMGAVIAVFLSCMGLLAMVILVIGQRVREIGIRKVLGASARVIVLLLAKDFMVLVGLAILIASPIAWYLMDRWLQSFPYRISISWLVFAVAGLLSLGIAFLTIALRAIKAALSNPVQALRSE